MPEAEFFLVIPYVRRYPFRQLLSKSKVTLSNPNWNDYRMAFLEDLGEFFEDFTWCGVFGLKIVLTNTGNPGWLFSGWFTGSFLQVISRIFDQVTVASTSIILILKFCCFL